MIFQDSGINADTVYSGHGDFVNWICRNNEGYRIYKLDMQRIEKTWWIVCMPMVKVMTVDK